MFKLVLRIVEMDDFEIDLYTTKSMDEMDKYTTENYEKEQDLINNYQKKIGDIVDYCDRTKKNILFLITNTEDKSYRKKVLYKKHKRIFKQIIKNQKFMIRIIKASKSKEELAEIFSEFTYQQIDRLEHTNRLNQTYIEEVISNWRSQIKKGNNYYKKIRKVLSYYNGVYENFNFPSFDEVYQQYLELKKSKEEIKNAREEEKHVDYELIKKHRNDYDRIPKKIDGEPEFVPNSEEYQRYEEYLESIPNEFNPHIDEENRTQDDNGYTKVFIGRKKI